MSIINIDQILQSNDVGKNLEDDAVFYHFERLLQGKKEVLDSDAKTVLVQAEPPAWSESFDLAIELLGQSKDLRIVVGLIRSLIALHGLEGLEKGLDLLNQMLEKYWDNIYPVPEDEDDYIVRINALSPLNDWAETLLFLSQSIVFNNKVNKLTFRVFGLTSSKLQLREGEQLLSVTQLKYVMAEVPQDIKDGVVSLIEKSVSHISAIRRIYDNTIGIVPDFSALLGVLNWVKPFLNKANDDDLSVKSEVTTENIAVPIEVVVSKPERKLSTKEDVVAILEEVCVFLEQTEPAHPAPLFIRRGQKLLKMNFLEIVKELSPNAYEDVCKLGGIDPD